MSLATLSKRLARIEARRGSGRIAGLCNLAGHPPEVVIEAVRNWRAWIADGRAGRIGDVLILRAPRLTVGEWLASVAHHRRGAR